MKYLFLVMAIIGAVVPYAFFFGYFADYGFSPPMFVGSLFVNGAAGGFTADLLITSVVFWMYLFHVSAPRTWLYILVNCTIGLSCALPLYYYFEASRTSDQTA